MLKINQCRSLRRLTIFFITVLMVTVIQLVSAYAASGVEPSGEGTEDSPYLIGTTEELVWFRDSVNSGNTSINAKLTADIDISEVGEWTPIGSSSNVYSGSFDGDGHTIKGMYINVNSTQKANQGLFGVVTLATVGNFTIEGKIDVTADVENVAGAIAKAVSSRIYNINSKVDIDVNITNDSESINNKIAGVVAYFDVSLYEEYSTDMGVYRCVNYGSLTVYNNGSHCLAGVVAYACSSGSSVSKKGNTTTITSCGNVGSVVSKATTATSPRIAGILGIINMAYNDVMITGCYNMGNIESNFPDKTGSIVGYFKGYGHIGTGVANYWLASVNEKGCGSGTITEEFGKAVYDEQFESGEVTYLLNDCLSSENVVWYQTIGVDKYPVMSSDSLVVVQLKVVELVSGDSKLVYGNEINDGSLSIDRTEDGYAILIDTDVYGGEGDAMYLDDMDICQRVQVDKKDTYNILEVDKPFVYEYTDDTLKYARILLDKDELEADESICATVTVIVDGKSEMYLVSPVLE